MFRKLFIDLVEINLLESFSNISIQYCYPPISKQNIVIGGKNSHLLFLPLKMIDFSLFISVLRNRRKNLKLFSSFSRLFLCFILVEPYRDRESYDYLSFLNSWNLGFGNKQVFLRFFVKILTLESGSVNPQSDLIWFDLIWFDLIWFDLIWFDLIWFDLIWFDLKYRWVMCSNLDIKVPSTDEGMCTNLDIKVPSTNEGMCN